MPGSKARVAYLEGGSRDQAGALGDVRSAIADVRNAVADVRDATAGVRSEIADVRNAVTELRGDMNSRFVVLDTKIDHHFTWLVGIQVGVLLAVVSALVGSHFR